MVSVNVLSKIVNKPQDNVVSILREFGAMTRPTVIGRIKTYLMGLFGGGSDEIDRPLDPKDIADSIEHGLDGASSADRREWFPRIADMSVEDAETARRIADACREASEDKGN